MGRDESQTVIWHIITPDGGIDLTTYFSLTVENVPPSVIITGSDSVTSGVAYGLSLGNVVDPGNDTVTACTIDWGDGASEDCFGELGGGSLSHNFGTSYATPTIMVNLTDEDGIHVAAAKTVTVTGVTTGLGVDQSSISAYESQNVANTGSYSPRDANFSWSASEGVVTDEGNGVWSWSLAAGSAEGSRTVTLSAGGQNTSSPSTSSATVQPVHWRTARPTTATAMTTASRTKPK